MQRLLLIGLDPPESAELIARTGMPATASPVLPRLKLERGSLLVERTGAAGRFLPVDRVIYHGIFEDDFDTLTALALWGGPCLPSALGMMDCRQRIPGLARALRVTRFGSLPRSWGGPGTTLDVAAHPSVAKWGNWHCGEDKEQFTGRRSCDVSTLAEDFVDGQAVRIMMIGERAWQIRLTGDGWKKSIHPDDAAFMPVDPDLLADTIRLRDHFGLEVIGNDYMIADDGRKYLLEVNHIPNVTRFDEIRSAYIDFASGWATAGG
jgi:hypothetical protein